MILDDAGRRIAVTNTYYPSGELKTRSGVGTYPVEYGFDAQGRMTNMITWQDHAGDSGRAVTTWSYDPSWGWLTQKGYQGTNGPTYTYTPAGRLRTRTWARGLTTTYETNAAGEVVGIAYDDAVTPDVTYHLDRLGRRTNVVDGAASRILAYSDSGRLLSETNVSGLLAGVGVDHDYDSLQRRTKVIEEGRRISRRHKGTEMNEHESGSFLARDSSWIAVKH